MPLSSAREYRNTLQPNATRLPALIAGILLSTPDRMSLRIPTAVTPPFTDPPPAFTCPRVAMYRCQKEHGLALEDIYLSTEFSHAIELNTYVVIGSDNLRWGIPRAIFVRSTDQIQPLDAQTEGFVGFSTSTGE